LHRLLGLLGSADESGLSGKESFVIFSVNASEIVSINAGRVCGSAAADGLRGKARTDTLSGSHVALLLGDFG
jgi:hypothetical protein